MANQPVPTGVELQTTGSTTGGQLDLSNLLPSILFKFIDVLGGALIIAIGIFVVRYIRSRMRKLETEHEEQRNAINLLEKITSGFIIVVSVTLALKVVGIDMTLLVSVAILGLSYGLQDVIKNYVAGILILFKAPFKIGDTVKIKTFTGKITKMDFQSTTLETFDNKHITIYNSDVMTQSLINFSNNTVRRLDLDATIGYQSNIPQAIKIFEKILDTDLNVLKTPKFSIVFKSFSDLGITFTLRFWVQKPCNILKIRTEVASRIGQAFDEDKIFSPVNRQIQTLNETQLQDVTKERKQRIQVYYSQPIFAEAATPPPQGAEGALPPAEVEQQAPDYDEPEQQ